MANVSFSSRHAVATHEHVNNAPRYLPLDSGREQCSQVHNIKGPENGHHII
jgi:hypothetical protein